MFVSSLRRTRGAHAAAFLAVTAILGIAPACRRRAPEPPPPPRVAAAPEAPHPAPEPASASAGGYDFHPAERAAVEAFLRQNPDLRLATDGDRRSPDGGEDMTSLYGVYHPYFVRGDVNDDGVLDFVLGFVRRDSDRDSPWFSVVVFSGRGDGGFAGGVFLERDISLADGDVSLDRDAIVVTPDTSDEATRRYRWDPIHRRHVFVRDQDEEPETPPAAQT
ncbi:MAG TPA: hypothetical protein VGH97_13135 [Thermoanaerobaculia bacterium]